MTDYIDRQQPSYGYSEYRGADPSMDDDAMHRSVTRGSHQSQASGVSLSTKSWVQSHQAHQRLATQESMSSGGNGSYPNVRRSRPLPDPQFRHSRVPVKYGLDPGHDLNQRQEFKHMDINKNDFPFGYQNQPVHETTSNILTQPSPDILNPPSGSRSFVGGFFKGLKRIPKMLGGGTKAEGKRIQRKGTFGTDGTSTTATGMERGNTLPRYLSNPSIGPSNPQFAHRLSMAVASGTLPTSAMPVDFHHRDNPTYNHPDGSTSFPYESGVYHSENPAGPQQPVVVTVTPPSDGIIEEQADFYDGTEDEYSQHPTHHHLEDIMEDEPSMRGRATTVMVYNTESQAPTDIPPVSTSPPRRSNTGRVSYQQDLPTRASVQAQMPLPQHSSNMGHMASTRPVTQESHPTMQTSSPTSFLSPTNTSRYTMTTFASHYDPSFASDLTPIEKFFKGLYNLPWVAERVTVDYRPANSDRARKKAKKEKPMSSWYRSMLTRSRRISATVDILSNGTGTISGLDLGSPVSRHSERSSTRRHHSAKAKGSHRTRRRATADNPPRRAPSPILPTPYPYTYPAMYQYPYPYNGYMPAPQTTPRDPRAHHRRKGAKRYASAAAATATGYAAYQPMAMPPPPPSAPIYFIAPSPPQSNNGGAPNGEGVQDPQQAQYAAQYQYQYQYQPQGYQPHGYQPQAGPLQISPVIMHYVPGTLNPNPTIPVSPPLTPQRHATHNPS